MKLRGKSADRRPRGRVVAVRNHRGNDLRSPSCSEPMDAMAKARLNSALQELRGEIDGFVFKNYGGKVVVTRRPDMSGIKPTKAQLAHRARFRAAGRYADAAMKDPVRRTAYTRVAAQRKIPIRAVLIEEHFRRNPK